RTKSQTPNVQTPKKLQVGNLNRGRPAGLEGAAGCMPAERSRTWSFADLWNFFGAWTFGVWDFLHGCSRLPQHRCENAAVALCRILAEAAKVDPLLLCNGGKQVDRVTRLGPFQLAAIARREAREGHLAVQLGIDQLRW